MEFSLQTSSPICQVEPVGPTRMVPGGSTEQCFEIQCTSQGKVPLSARVYDQLWDKDKLVRIEDWLAAQGYPNQSHAELEFHTYVDGVKWYPDLDGDGHGSAKAPPVLLCTDDDPPPHHVPSNDDCDDGDPNNFPGNEEACGDGADNDCDGSVDEDCNQCKEGLECGTYTGNTCQCAGPLGADCGRSPEGDPVCFAHFFCSENPTCDTSADCPDGRRCIIDTCCGGGRCAPNTCLVPTAAGLNHTPIEGRGPRSDGQ